MTSRSEVMGTLPGDHEERLAAVVHIQVEILMEATKNMKVQIFQLEEMGRQQHQMVYQALSQSSQVQEQIADLHGGLSNLENTLTAERK